jgi:hypothetical protein
MQTWQEFVEQKLKEAAIASGDTPDDRTQRNYDVLRQRQTQAGRGVPFGIPDMSPEEIEKRRQAKLQRRQQILQNRPQ